jgi:hypothetical protein
MGTTPGVPRATPGQWSTQLIVLVCAFVSVIPATFVGMTAAAAFTDAIPTFTTAWQSSIVCASGEHLIAEEHDVPSSTPPYTGTGASWTYRCAGPDSISDSRTAMVFFLEFVAGTLLSYPVSVVLSLIIGFEIAKIRRRRLQQEASIPPPFWPQVPPGRFSP